MDKHDCSDAMVRTNVCFVLKSSQILKSINILRKFHVFTQNPCAPVSSLRIGKSPKIISFVHYCTQFFIIFLGTGEGLGLTGRTTSEDNPPLGPPPGPAPGPAPGPFGAPPAGPAPEGPAASPFGAAAAAGASTNPFGPPTVRSGGG